MTLYGQSNLAYVIVPAESGGCGEPHRRPVEQGAPAKLWALECSGGCEDFLRLRHSDQWSTTLAELPETYDERKSREDFDKRGAGDVQTMLALALARITGGEIPATVAAMVTGNKQHIPGLTAATMLCPDGHENPPGKKFCGDCGATMHQGAPAAALEAPAAPAAPNGHTNGNGHAVEGWEPPRTGQGRKKPMRDWRLEDLQTYAGQLGVDPAGSRNDLIERLRAAKKETVPA